MTFRHRTMRRDENEGAIVDALEQCGCLVHRLDGAPFDLLVFRSTRVFLLEVKSSAAASRRKGATAERQAKFRRRGWPVHVVLSAKDALRAVGFVDVRSSAAANGERARAWIEADLARIGEAT